MTDYTPHDEIDTDPAFGDTFPCPCCGEAIPNFTLMQRIDFDADEWQKRVTSLTEMIRAGYPEYQESADAFASMIVSISTYHASLPRQIRETVEEEARQLPLPLPIGFVYFIQAIDGGPIKIGYSRDPESRTKTIQSAKTLQVLATLPGNYKLEAELHKKFALTRLNGEWFSETPELMEFIAHVRSQYPRIAS